VRSMKFSVTKQQIGAIVIVLLFGGSAVVYAISAAFPEDTDVARGPTAQAFLEVRICGENIDLPDIDAENDIGISMSDGRVNFPSGSGVTLGDVFDEMNITFTDSQIMEYENNNMCNTTYRNEVSVSKGKTIEGMEEPLRPMDLYRSYRLEHGDYVVVRYD